MSRYRDPTSEQYTLGCFLVEPSLLDETRLTESHFGDALNRNLFSVLKEMRQDGKHIDITTIAQLPKGQQSKFGGLEYVNELISAIPTISAFETYEKGVIQESKMRQAKNIANKFLFHSANPDALQEFVESVSNLEVRDVEKKSSFKTIVSERQKYHMSRPKSGMSGIDTGFSALNTMTEGWQNSDLIIIGARPSMGKTAFVIHSMLQSMRRDRDVFPTFFSIEMADGPIVDRMISNISKINLHKLKNPPKHFGNNQKDWEHYTKSIAYLEKLEMDLRRENKVPDIRAAVRQNMRNHPDKKHVVYIDFLTMIKPTKPKQSRHHEIEEVVIDLKRMADELNVPVIVLAQLSRGLEQRERKRPMLSDLRESGAIEQSADVVLFLYRDEYYNPGTELPGIIEVIIAKNRNGATGKFDMRFVKETNSFYEIDAKREAV